MYTQSNFSVALLLLKSIYQHLPFIDLSKMLKNILLQNVQIVQSYLVVLTFAIHLVIKFKTNYLIFGPSSSKRCLR